MGSMPKAIYDWEDIQRFHDAGHGFVECRRRFGFSHTAWVKAIKRGQLRSAPALFQDRRRRFDWRDVQALYDRGQSYRECQRQFGFSAMAWNKAVARGEIRPRPLGKSLAELLRSGRSRYNIKRRLLQAGILKNRCSECGLIEWNGKALVMHIDHINGVRDDHRLENLRMLCPNCHSQTETYGARNRGRRKGLHETGGTL